MQLFVKLFIFSIIYVLCSSSSPSFTVSERILTSHHSAALHTPKVLYHSILLANNAENLPTKEPIVVLHGLLGSYRNFQTWARILRQKTKNEHDIICIDLRNHGRSSIYGSLPITYHSMAADVKHTLRTLRIPKCHLIGHSMGGKAAAAATLLATELPTVLSLTIMDISPITYQPKDFQSVIETVKTLSELSEVMKMQDMSKNQLAELVGKHFPDVSLAQFILSNAIREKDRFRWSFNIDSIASSMNEIMEFQTQPRYDDFKEVAREVGASSSSLAPTLVLKGSKSDFVRMGHLKSIAELFPRYTLATVRDAAHWIHFEQPDQSAEKVANFLEHVKNLLAEEANQS
eukprot:gene6963-7704_t